MTARTVATHGSPVTSERSPKMSPVLMKPIERRVSPAPVVASSSAVLDQVHRSARLALTHEDRTDRDLDGPQLGDTSPTPPRA